MRMYNKGVGIAFGVVLALGQIGCDNSPDEEIATPEPEPPLMQEARKAEVGVGKQGAKLRADNSIATKMVGGAAAQALFDTKEKVAFEIKIPQALALYRAQDSFGKGPQTHEEFMEKIIRANNIELPKLPEGMHYNYRPDGGEKGEGELWVEPDAPAGNAEVVQPAEGQPNP